MLLVSMTLFCIVVQKPLINAQITETVSQCGGIFNAASGSIYYKMNQPIEANERCVWIIRTSEQEFANVAGYKVEVNSLLVGFSEMTGNHEVILSSFQYRWGIHDESHIKIKKLDTYNVAGSLIMVTFATGNTTFNLKYHRSLQIDYEALHDSNSQPTNSSIYILTGAYLRYPPFGTYQNREVSPFLFKQSNRKINPLERIHVTVNVISLELGCGDKLDIFKFNGSHWLKTDQVCHTNETRFFSNDDLMLIMFRSEGSITLSGFELRSELETRGFAEKLQTATTQREFYRGNQNIDRKPHVKIALTADIME